MSAWGVVTGPRGVSQALIKAAPAANPTAMMSRIRQSNREKSNAVCMVSLFSFDSLVPSLY
jgi:hypothetical protein